MQRTALVTLTSSVLLVSMILATAIAHASYLEACVCVVNSAARAMVCLAGAVASGVFLGAPPMGSIKWYRVGEALQLVFFLFALFFLVQHVFFVLQLA